MRVRIYKYIGEWGGGIEYDDADKEPGEYMSHEDYDFVGIWDLPDDFVETCLPAGYIE